MKTIKSFLLISFLGLGIQTQAQQKDTPKLMVGIVIDQMCYEYLYRYQEKFGKDGFRKLMENGTHCRNTQYNYVPTFTGPGHASIYTGTTPSNHGIVANDWYDRNTGAYVNCVDDSLVNGIGTDSEEGKCSPHYLKANTITDQLKITYPNSKVVSVSIKDRGAILPGGHLSDGSYWFDYSSGNFVTSSFYKKELPYWVENFNNKKFPDYYLTQTWDTFYELSKYTESTVDNSPYEHTIGGKKTPTFPYDFSTMEKEDNGYDLFTHSPFANTYLTDFAQLAIQNEYLGYDEQTDFLCISYSTPDIAGHAFGPQSIELEDIYIRLDLEIARLIKYLEKNVGKKDFTLFLTADHAVVPVPQFLVDNQLPGGYLFLDKKKINLHDNVKAKFGADIIQSIVNNNVYLDQEVIALFKLDPNDVETFIINEIKQWEGVKSVFRNSEINASAFSSDSWLKMIQLGYSANNSGDIIFMLEPGYLPKSTDKESSHKGTSHGSAFNYDTHVPLIFYGKGIPKQEIFRTINIIDITATLTHLLYLQKPNATTGEPILEILQPK
jgi:predicted AlkP superfamily pyrophosphatase or phosphodiesterase